MCQQIIATIIMVTITDSDQVETIVGPCPSTHTVMVCSGHSPHTTSDHHCLPPPPLLHTHTHLLTGVCVCVCVCIYIQFTSSLSCGVLRSQLPLGFFSLSLAVSRGRMGHNTCRWTNHSPSTSISLRPTQYSTA